MFLHMRGGVMVREARERAGLTQAGLAARVGTTQSAIARIENGAEPTLPRLEDLLAACGVSMQIHLARFDADETDPSERAWRPSDPIVALGRAGVPFLLAGRAAASLHGVPVEVGVPVAVVDLGADAISRLAAVLDDLHARRRVAGDMSDGTLPLDRSPTALRSRRRWELDTAVGPIDVDFEPLGTRGYQDLVRRAVDIAGVSVTGAADAARQLDAAGDDLAVITHLRRLAG
jgi:transcriptional regulator with XRE-family HTH domain